MRSGRGTTETGTGDIVATETILPGLTVKLGENATQFGPPLPKRRIRWKRGLDLLALLGIIQGLWGIDVAIFSPQLLLIHWGYYLGLMYIQIGAAGVWLFARARG